MFYSNWTVFVQLGKTLTAWFKSSNPPLLITTPKWLNYAHMEIFLSLRKSLILIHALGLQLCSCRSASRSFMFPPSYLYASAALVCFQVEYGEERNEKRPLFCHLWIAFSVRRPLFLESRPRFVRAGKSDAQPARNKGPPRLNLRSGWFSRSPTLLGFERLSFVSFPSSPPAFPCLKVHHFLLKRVDSGLSLVHRRESDLLYDT